MSETSRIITQLEELKDRGVIHGHWTEAAGRRRIWYVVPQDDSAYFFSTLEVKAFILGAHTVLSR